jgi:predicted esterase
MRYPRRQLLWPACIALTTMLLGVCLAADETRTDQPPPSSQPATSQPATSQPQVRRGTFITRFEQRSEISRVPAIIKRLAVKLTRKVEDYRLADESFKVIVPESYDPKTPCGVLVFVSPSDQDLAMGDAYAELLAKQGLVFVGALNSGNQRQPLHRFGLALDALSNIQARYNIDPKRVYISGMSGGGRIASRLGIVYADVFSGAFPLCGCDYFRNIPVPGKPQKMWARRFKQPLNAVLTQAKRHNRYVLLTGETDFNRLQTKAVYRRYVRDRFAQVTYLEVPGMGHEYPPPLWFEKCLIALDTKPLKPETRTVGGVRVGTSKVSARRRMILARQYFRAKADAAGRKQLRKLLVAFPDSAEAAEAQRMLAESLQDQ